MDGFHQPRNFWLRRWQRDESPRNIISIFRSSLTLMMELRTQKLNLIISSLSDLHPCDFFKYKNTNIEKRFGSESRQTDADFKTEPKIINVPLFSPGCQKSVVPALGVGSWTQTWASPKMWEIQGFIQILVPKTGSGGVDTCWNWTKMGGCE